MSGPVTVAIDAGTGSCRAAVFDSGGRALASAHREWSHAPAPGVPDSQVFDTEANWALIGECVRESVAAAAVPPAAVAAVSATSMREGMVLYDGDGRELWACPNVDSRAGEQVAELVASGDADEIYARSGDWVAITAPARLRWIAAEQPEVLAATRHLTMLSDWVLQRLSGEFVTDPSIGSSSGMFELADRTWSREIVALCGLDPSVLPPVREPGTAIGTVTPAAAEVTGLRAGTPVVLGGADTQMGLVGIGVTQPGRVTIVGGTFWQHTVLLDRPLIDPEGRLRTLCHALPGRWMMEGIGFYIGLVMRWFRDAFCEREKEEAARRGVDAYVAMEELAAREEVGATGVLGLFSNVMTARRWVHASPAFMGFDVADPARAGRGAFIRAIEESAAYVSLAHHRIVEELMGAPVEEAVFTGGAAKGTLWPQVVADVLGVPLTIPVEKESSCLGTAICAGVGAGIHADIDDAVARLVRTERVVTPDPVAHEAYAELSERWAGAYRAALGLVDDGVLRPLWRAAGT